MTMIRFACLTAIAMMVPATAFSNGTHKRLSRSELDATVTCIKQDKKEISVEVLADALKEWLVRAEGGDRIIAQDVKTLDISAVNKPHKTVTTNLTFLNGRTESSVHLRLNSVVGTDDSQQDRSVALSECTRVNIKTHELSQRSMPGHQTAD